VANAPTAFSLSAFIFTTDYFRHEMRVDPRVPQSAVALAVAYSSYPSILLACIIAVILVFLIELFVKFYLLIS